MARYVVKCEHRFNNGITIVDSDQYLVFAHFNPYNKPHDMSDAKWLSEAQEEAFKFRERAAAEVMAATWGGKVVKLVPRKK